MTSKMMHAISSYDDNLYTAGIYCANTLLDMYVCMARDGDQPYRSIMYIPRTK